MYLFCGCETVHFMLEHRKLTYFIKGMFKILKQCHIFIFIFNSLVLHPFLFFLLPALHPITHFPILHPALPALPISPSLPTTTTFPKIRIFLLIQHFHTISKYFQSKLTIFLMHKYFQHGKYTNFPLYLSIAFGIEYS